MNGSTMSRILTGNEVLCAFAMEYVMISHVTAARTQFVQSI